MSAAPNSVPRSEGLIGGLDANEHFVGRRFGDLDVGQRDFELAAATNQRAKLQSGAWNRWIHGVWLS
jgi:hypothetical protein